MFKHVLIPTDGSDVSTKALRSGIEFAKSLGAKVTALHVSPTYRQLSDEGYMAPIKLGRSAWEESVTQRAAEILDAVVSAAKKAGVKCETEHVFHNTAHKAIIDTANSAGCDVIVMGSHGYGAAKSIMLGSQTTRVLAQCKIPVLVLR